MKVQKNQVDSVGDCASVQFGRFKISTGDC